LRMACIMMHRAGASRPAWRAQSGCRVCRAGPAAGGEAAAGPPARSGAERARARARAQVNELLIEEEDYAGLRESITTFDNYDQIGLATRLERHELMEFRRIAAHIYKANLRWRKAVALAKQDRLYKARRRPGAGVLEVSLVIKYWPETTGCITSS